MTDGNGERGLPLQRCAFCGVDWYTHHTCADMTAHPTVPPNESRYLGDPVPYQEPELRVYVAAEVEALRAENERLREALRGLISCHGMAVNPGTQHAKCGFLAAAHAALSGSSAAEGAE